MHNDSLVGLSDAELVDRYRSGNSQETVQIEEIMVKRYENLLNGCARRVLDSLPAELVQDRTEASRDVKQDGFFGLQAALNGYNSDRGRFSSYAWTCIENKMWNSSAIEPGVTSHYRRQIPLLIEIMEKLRGELGHKPSIAELAVSLGWGEERVRNTLRVMRFSFAESFEHEDGGQEGVDGPPPQPAQPLFPDAQPTDPIDVVIMREKMKQLGNALQQLRSAKPQHYNVLILKYYEDLDHKEIADWLDISHDNARTMLTRAIGYLSRIMDRQEETQ